MLARQMHRSRHPRGFTLIEVVIALSIIGLVTAVAVPVMARRVDEAFRAADLALIFSRAKLLPARVATLGVELVLDKEGLARPLPDGHPPLELPEGWRLLGGDDAPRFGRGASCIAGELTLQSPEPAQRWRLHFADLSCEAQLTSLVPGQ